MNNIEAELRYIQHYQGAQAAAIWWKKNFAHKYPFHRYDVARERIVSRDDR